MISFPLSSFIFGLSTFIFEHQLMRYSKTLTYQFILIGITSMFSFIILALAYFKKKKEQLLK
jgi:hypothetical protein